MTAFLIILGLLVLTGVGVGIYFLVKKNNTQTSTVSTQATILKIQVGKATSKN